MAERENALSAFYIFSKTLANFNLKNQVVVICSKILNATSCYNPFFKSVPDNSKLNQTKDFSRTCLRYTIPQLVGSSG